MNVDNYQLYLGSEHNLVFWEQCFVAVQDWEATCTHQLQTSRGNLHGTSWRPMLRCHSRSRIPSPTISPSWPCPWRSGSNPTSVVHWKTATIGERVIYTYIYTYTYTSIHRVFFPPQLGIGPSCQDKFGFALLCDQEISRPLVRQTCPYHERYCIPFPGIAFKEAHGCNRSCSHLEKICYSGGHIPKMSCCIRRL